MDPIKCANLLLCTVKQVQTERPNTLQVISPEATITVQASDEANLREWIAVVEAGIGWQLTKKQQDSAEQAQLTSVTFSLPLPSPFPFPFFVSGEPWGLFLPPPLPFSLHACFLLSFSLPFGPALFEPIPFPFPPFLNIPQPLSFLLQGFLV